MSTTSRGQALAFLEERKVAVLSTVSEKGEAWGAAIYYVIEQNFTFYFFTHVESKKYKNIQAHPQAALTVVDDPTQTTVQVSGKIAKVPMSEELNTVYRQLARIHPPGQLRWAPPVSKNYDEGPLAVLKLTPDEVRFSQFKLDKPHSDVSIIHTL